MQALAAGGLGKGGKAQLFQPRLQGFGRVDHIVEIQVGRRIEIEDEAAGYFGAAGRAIPGMQFQRPGLGGGDQRFDAVDLQVRLAVAADFHLGEKGGLPLAGMALEKALLAFDAVGRAHQRAGPALDVRQHPAADRFVIARQFQLGDGLAFVGIVGAGIGPQRLVGMRDGKVHHHRAGLGLGSLGFRQFAGLLRCLGLHLCCRLVGAQALEGSLAHHAVAGPAGEFDLRHQVRFQPVDVARMRFGRIPSGKRRGLRRHVFQPWQQFFHLGGGITGADAADIDEMPVTIHARQQRAKFPGGGRPAADHHFMPGPAFGLGPVFAAPATIGRAAALGDDAFQVHAAGRLQHRFAAAGEMLDIAQLRALAFEQAFQPRLARAKRQRAQILAVREQQVESEEDQGGGLSVRQRRLQRREIRRAVMVQGADFAVNQAIRQPRRQLGDGGELVRPVQPLAGA